ncbi:hypothetical protein BP6252_04534 [Coleophoma cylindrospora]|uniref:Carboxylic ester hydrolase n=1 Tax=Coleophoma cylindrospora TaxID=1849047 RepID=A0A3D8S0V2_9HELO|nr:hypothetical protein BP6252_04534 [Coleophoma cylindrospora]
MQPSLGGLLLSFLHLIALCSASNAGLMVTTSTGSFTGMLNPRYNNVREFRSVPYAKPPVGERRWLPPANLSRSSKHSTSIRFPPSCPQYVSGIHSVWSDIVPQYFINDGNFNTTAGLQAQSSAEDCLKLAIWTPANATSNSSLPVLMFMTGGGFSTGGIDIDYQVPPSWVSRTQSHIVVTINYRVNIMGFPNAAGLDDQNLGILDQRMALEWLHANVKSFGGNPNAITLWGQSAGSMSTSYHSYAYYGNPIAAGYFMQSGTALKPLGTPDVTHTNFTFVAKNLGCDFPEDADAELDCMRQVPINMIINFWGQYSDSGKTPALRFAPIADERIIFSNYTARAEAGLVAKVPAISSNAANEAASLSTYPANNVTAGPYQVAVDAATLSDWICDSANNSALRKAGGLTTYRYQHASNFSNISPLDWLGAYHSSDLPFNFGTYGIVRGNGTAFEREVSETMQNYIYAFITDPENGPRQLGWVPFDPDAADGGTMLRFGADGLAVQNVTGNEVDGPCFGIGTYDSSP